MHLPPPSSIHLHPALFTSTQVISTSTQLSAVSSTLLEPKYCIKLGNFPRFRPKKSKSSFLTENWYTWYLGGADSESGLKFLILRPQNQFSGKLGPKKFKMSDLPKKWHTDYLEDDDSYSDISFLNLQPYFHFWANLGWKI